MNWEWDFENDGVYDQTGQSINYVFPAAGDHTVKLQVEDANGCISRFSVAISNFNTPIITVDNITNILCQGDCNGAIDVTVTGGTSPYVYLWNPAPVQITEDLSNACAGSYTLEVRDALGCITFKDTVITESLQLTATIIVNDGACGECNGIATISPTGGTAPYTFQWSDGAAQTTASAINLCAGVYSVDVTDASGCLETFAVNVNDTGGPTGATVIENPASCFNVCDGSADVSPIGGVTPYTYYWIHDGTVTSNVSGLCGGLYKVEILDSNKCKIIQDITILTPDEIADSAYIVATTCGGADGSIILTISGGVGPYTYAWCHGPTVASVIGLSAGFYCVDVTDATGCVQHFDYTLPASTAPNTTVNVIDVTCNGVCDGLVNLTISGGSSPYVVTWYDNSGTPTGQLGPSITGVCAGGYVAEVTDVLGCSSYVPVTVSAPSSIVFSSPLITNVSCGGACDGEVTVIPSGGVLPYAYSWNTSPVQITSTAIDVCAGVWDVTVSDANGCSSIQQITVVEPAPLVYILDELTDAFCATQCDGVIATTISGGSKPYVINWIGPNGFTAGTEGISSLCLGEYILNVTDINSCSITDTLTISVLETIVVDAGIDKEICEKSCVDLIGATTTTIATSIEWKDELGNVIGANDTLNVCPTLTGANRYVYCAVSGNCFSCDTVEVTLMPLPIVDAGEDITKPAESTATLGGNPTGPNGSSYSWTPTDGMLFGDSTVANPDLIVEKGEINYIVTVISADGCVSVDTVLIHGVISFPDGISPNGDGKNDVWVIPFIDQFPNAEVEIYNRWGELLFHSIGYTTPWDGTYNGDLVPVGSYYYIIELNDPVFMKTYTGPITVIR